MNQHHDATAEFVIYLYVRGGSCQAAHFIEERKQKVVEHVGPGKQLQKVRVCGESLEECHQRTIAHLGTTVRSQRPQYVEHTLPHPFVNQNK